MANQTDPQHQLAELFKQEKCYTIDQLRRRLNYSLISIRRFLKVIGYYSSFTHNSMWYTLRSIPSFDKNGIWFYQDIGFCKHGNLNQTIGRFIDKSFQGLTAKDLFNMLSVPCHPVLNQMYKKKKIDRYHTPKGFVYLSVSESKKKLQLKRLQVLTPAQKIQRLNPQAAVYVLVELIKNPKASFFELSVAVKKKGVTASQQAIAQLFKDYDLKNSTVIELIQFFRNQAFIHNLPNRLFDKTPTIPFEPEQTHCPICQRCLCVRKTRNHRKITAIGIGTFIAHETIKYCPQHSDIGSFKSGELPMIVPADSNIAFNVLVEVGKLRFNENRQVAEIQLILLQKHAIKISTSEVEVLINNFLFYLTAVHQQNNDLIKQYIEKQGGYILHLDATCQGDSPKLVSSIDPISGFVLYSAKIKSENKEDLIGFLKEIKNRLGVPLAVVSDMAKAIKSAVKSVFGDIAHYICHFHFLQAIGLTLFDNECSALRKALSKAAVAGNLKTIRGKMSNKFDEIPISEIETFIEKPEQFGKALIASQLSIYYLILWILDYGSNADGYGFPFDHRHLNFYNRLKTAYSLIKEVIPLYSIKNKNRNIIWKLYHEIKEIVENSALEKKIKQYEIKLSVFSQLRDALGTVPENVNNGLSQMKETGTHKELKEQEKNNLELFFRI